MKVLVEIPDEEFEQLGNYENLTVRRAQLLANDIVARVRDGQTAASGKWIRVDKTKVMCSNCEITHLIAQYPHGAIDWCPNCGADMRVED